MSLTIKELIPIGGKILSEAGVENAEFDAEALLGFEIGFDKQKIFMNWTYEVEYERTEAYFDLVSRRAAGEPLQYITGEQFFFGFRFSVNPAVLIPRPETEQLAEKAVEFLRSREKAKSVLDLCTGCGALAVSIVKTIPRVKVLATDISEDALAVARGNAQALGVSDRVEFLKSDLFGSIKRGVLGRKFDLIVTNPPYIRTGDLSSLQREVRDHEPVQALDGGDDGLDFYRRIAEGARSWMREGACLMAEIGCDQGPDVVSIFEAAGFKAAVSPDLAGIDRFVTAE